MASCCGRSCCAWRSQPHYQEVQTPHDAETSEDELDMSGDERCGAGDRYENLPPPPPMPDRPSRWLLTRESAPFRESLTCHHHDLRAGGYTHAPDILSHVGSAARRQDDSASDMEPEIRCRSCSASMW